MNFRINVMKQFTVGFLFTASCAVSFLSVNSVEHAHLLDQYGGFTAVSLPGGGTGYFAIAKFGSRWMFVDPLGNAYFAKGADLIKDIATTPGNLISYSSIYTYDAVNSTFSSNLKVQAEDITPNDVINNHGITVQDPGDTLYIGYGRPFNDTYLNVTTLGSGGRIQWYYSAAGGTWKLINGTGNPRQASKLNADGSYNLDIGNYLVPDGKGFYRNYQSNGNLVNWWTPTSWGSSYVFLPSDFAPARVNGDTNPLYYIKGLVTRSFATPPKVGQIADLTSMYDARAIKYSVNGTDQLQKWYNRTVLRMKTWGLNLAPYGSTRVWQFGPRNPTNRVPEIITWQLSGDSMEGRYYGYTNSTAAKNVYDGTGCGVYQGKQADVFDPNYKINMYDRARVDAPGTPIDKWTVGIDPEEADWVFGFGSHWKHAHVAFVILIDDPYKSNGTDPLGHTVAYANPTLYSKYALADDLRYEYKASGDPIPPFTTEADVMNYYNTYVNSASSYSSQALQNLNKAWSMKYSKWGSSMHYSKWGLNAGWGQGSGFMDESSNDLTLIRHVVNGCRGLNPLYFATNPTAIATDLNSFEGLFAVKYGVIMNGAVKAVAPHTMVGLFLYQPPDEVARALGPYADFFEISPEPIPGGNDIYQEGKRIYDALRKPVIYHDYHQANADSPITFGGTITGLTYSGGQTAVTWTGVPHEMRVAMRPEFPGSTTAPCNVQWQRAIAKANWKTVWLNGDYTHCTSIGQPFRMYGGDNWVHNFYQSDTQALRGAVMASEYAAYNALQGADGTYFTAGIAHWAWVDDSAMSGSEWGNFGLVTAWDNAYDGVEARVAVSRDSSGYFVGGEARDYGNLIAPLSSYWLSLNNSSNLPGIGVGIKGRSKTRPPGRSKNRAEESR